MMYWISQTTNKRLTFTQLRHCLMRNFGGTNNTNEIVTKFLEKVTADNFCFEQSIADIEVSPY